MINDFQLSPLERKGVLRDAKQLTSQNSLSIRYYTEGTFTPGMGGQRILLGLTFQNILP